jgi:hypothetical protein
MQRLVEQPTGDGQVSHRTVPLGRVHYHLSVYQHFADQEDESVPAHVEVEGHIAPLDGLDLREAHRLGWELMLRMPDGRRLDFSIADDSGRIRSTGRGLFRD